MHRKNLERIFFNNLMYAVIFKFFTHNSLCQNCFFYSDSLYSMVIVDTFFNGEKVFVFHKLKCVRNRHVNITSTFPNRNMSRYGLPDYKPHGYCIETHPFYQKYYAAFFCNWSIVLSVVYKHVLCSLSCLLNWQYDSLSIFVLIFVLQTYAFKYTMP